MSNKFETRQSSCGKPQEAYRPRHNMSKDNLDFAASLFGKPIQLHGKSFEFLTNLYLHLHAKHNAYFLSQTIKAHFRSYIWRIGMYVLYMYGNFVKTDLAVLVINKRIQLRS